MRTVAATPDLVPFLLARMGPARASVVAAMSGMDAGAAVCGSIAQSSLTWCGLDAGGVVAMGGVMPQGGGVGYVWQYVTDGIAQNKRAYLEQGRQMTATGLRLHRRLVTVIEADYRAALRHCQRNGWSIGPVQTINGIPARVCERVP